MSPSDGDPVPNDRTVLRLPKPCPEFTPDGYAPTIDDVTPSTMDKARNPIRVSVWDSILTTIAEARAFRSGPSLYWKARSRSSAKPVQAR